MESLLNEAPLWLVILPLAALWAAYAVVKGRRREANAIQVKEQAVEAGLTEPPSLHPIIDQEKCIGCGTCVPACPEAKYDVLGLIAGKVELLNPTYCIGHGACKAACPVDAITLVFGTEKRGIDIPYVSPTFETNVPGVFIAGELGGMGLIRNAMEQGKQAIECIREKLGKKGASGDILDVLIVGAGPSGIAATLCAKATQLRSVTVEQDSLGGAVFKFAKRLARRRKVLV